MTPLDKWRLSCKVSSFHDAGYACTYALDPTTPSAAAAGDVASGMRAAAGRHVEKTAGARKDTAKFEQQVGQILDKVYQVLDQEQDFEGQRVGALLVERHG